MCFPRRFFGLLTLCIAAQELCAENPLLNLGTLNRDAVTRGLVSTLQQLTAEMQNPKFVNYHHTRDDFTRLEGEVQPSLSNASLLREVNIDYSKQFLATVELDRQAFEAYSHSSETKPVTRAVFDGVINASADLAIKAGLVRKSKIDQVETKVNTVDENGQPVRDCYVWYAPFLKDDDQHKQKFDKRSTPTTDFLSAGKWNIWTEKAGKTGAKTVYLCGDDGRPSRTIDVPGPK